MGGSAKTRNDFLTSDLCPKESIIPRRTQTFPNTVMKIYAFSAELESAVIELLEDTTFLLSQLSNSDAPACLKALRYLEGNATPCVPNPEHWC